MGDVCAGRCGRDESADEPGDPKGLRVGALRGPELRGSEPSTLTHLTPRRENNTKRYAWLGGQL